MMVSGSLKTLLLKKKNTRISKVKSSSSGAIRIHSLCGPVCNGYQQWKELVKRQGEVLTFREGPFCCMSFNISHLTPKLCGSYQLHFIEKDADDQYHIIRLKNTVSLKPAKYPHDVFHWVQREPNGGRYPTSTDTGTKWGKKPTSTNMGIQGSFSIDTAILRRILLSTIQTHVCQ